MAAGLNACPRHSGESAPAPAPAIPPKRGWRRVRMPRAAMRSRFWPMCDLGHGQGAFRQRWPHGLVYRCGRAAPGEESVIGVVILPLGVAARERDVVSTRPLLNRRDVPRPIVVVDHVSV